MLDLGEGVLLEGSQETRHLVDENAMGNGFAELFSQFVEVMREFSGFEDIGFAELEASERWP